jgi:hypothetical protein
MCLLRLPLLLFLAIKAASQKIFKGLGIVSMILSYEAHTPQNDTNTDTPSIF